MLPLTRGALATCEGRRKHLGLCCVKAPSGCPLKWKTVLYAEELIAHHMLSFSFPVGLQVWLTLVNSNEVTLLKLNNDFCTV